MDEFVVHELPVAGGTLAISPMPGRTRHFGADRERLLAWAPALVVTMCTQAELERKGSGGLGPDLAGQGIAWRILPVSDFGVPGQAVEDAWPEVEALALDLLRSGRKVLIHCFGGCGRSGMAVLRLMIAAGEDPDQALIRLRTVRTCAVETDAQMSWARMNRVEGGGGS